MQKYTKRQVKDNFKYAFISDVCHLCLHHMGNFSCKLSRNFVATLLHEILPCVTYPATDIPRNIFVAATARGRNQFCNRCVECCVAEVSIGAPANEKVPLTSSKTRQVARNVAPIKHLVLQQNCDIRYCT